MIEYIVTGGCSFSTYRTWPHFLRNNMIGQEIIITGHPSAGNDFISRAIIYRTQELLNKGIHPEKIAIVVMWSGFDRKSFFISPEYTSEYNKLLSINRPINPFNQFDEDYNQFPVKHTNGYLIGTSWCGDINPNIPEWKNYYFDQYHNLEGAAIENYEHFLRVQWFSKLYNIKLLNLTYADLQHYPYSPFENHDHEKKLTKDKFETINSLSKLMDYDCWWFWKKTGGLYEYAKDNNLKFEHDEVHPAFSAYEEFTLSILLPIIKRI